MIAARERGLTDRLTLVRNVVATTAPNAEVMRDNPLSKLPTLVLDDGTALYDSLVICMYFDDLHDAPPLVPRRGPKRWRALQRHALGAGFLDLLILLRNERDRPDDARSQPHIAAFLVKAAAILDHLEAHPPRVSAGPLDLEQITFGCVFGYLDFRFADLRWREGRPRLTEWAAWFDASPSAIATVPT
jgi:glutathione S-transferase